MGRNVKDPSLEGVAAMPMQFREADSPRLPLQMDRPVEILRAPIIQHCKIQLKNYRPIFRIKLCGKDSELSTSRIAG